MPQLTTLQKARKDLREGKSPSTAAGEFVREEMHNLEHGEGNAHSREQAIAIGLSRARRAGIPLKAPPAAKSSHSTHRRHQSR